MTLYTVTEAADLLNRPRSTVLRWVQEGRLKGRKIGKTWVVTAQALRNFSMPLWGGHTEGMRK